MILKVKREFKDQIVSIFELGLLNTYKLMYFDRNINEIRMAIKMRAINESCVTLGEY